MVVGLACLDRISVCHGTFHDVNDKFDNSLCVGFAFAIAMFSEWDYVFCGGGAGVYAHVATRG